MSSKSVSSKTVSSKTVSSTPVVSATHIEFTYPHAHEPVFSQLNVTFAIGWTAVLGDNGIGKTTLLRLLSGDLHPDAGQIAPNPNSIVLAYCSQQSEECPQNLEEFAYDWSSYAVQVKRDLGIEEDWPFRYSTLSGGEAKRVQIGCALVTQPDVLILDEPTNHVDGLTREQIIRVLQQYRGIGILVSHDIALIDEVCSHCVMFERVHTDGGIRTVARTLAGNYGQVHESMKRDAAASVARLEAARREVSRLSNVQAQRFQAVQHVNALKNSGSTINRKDHDARNALKLAKSTSTDSASAKSYAQMSAKIESAERIKRSIAVPAKTYNGEIWVETKPSSRSSVITLEFETIGNSFAERGLDDVLFEQYEQSTLISTCVFTDYASISRNETQLQQSKQLHQESQRHRETTSQYFETNYRETLCIGPTSHIALSGANGCGKTTVLELLASHIDPQVPYVYIAQHSNEDDMVQAITTLGNLSRQDQSTVLSAYAQLNADPDVLRAGENPSPGELRKLQLCLGVLSHPQLLVLDEPTNHLDIHSKEALSKLLITFPGAVVIASHDAWLLNEVGKTHWKLRKSSSGDNYEKQP